MATIKDVARAAGVSTSTVSKFMNGGHVRPEIAEALRRAVAELDYQADPFARSLKTRRSRCVGVLIPDMTAPFYGTVVMALDKVLREHGYHTLISCYGANHGLERDNLRFLISNGIDGLVYAPEDLSAEEFHELTASRRIPVVQMDRIIQGVNSDAVLVDNAQAAYGAVCRIVDRGHRRIGIITGPKSVFSAKERTVGYLRALSDRGILYDDGLVFSDANTFATGYRGCNALLALPDPPTAIFATNYDITVGLITAAREKGLKIPEELDVFGFDCREVCSMMHPPVPVVHQPEAEIGQQAAAYLIERLEGFDGEARMTRFRCSVVPE